MKKKRKKKDCVDRRLPTNGNSYLYVYEERSQLMRSGRMRGWVIVAASIKPGSLGKRWAKGNALMLPLSEFIEPMRGHLLS